MSNPNYLQVHVKDLAFLIETARDHEFTGYSINKVIKTIRQNNRDIIKNLNSDTKRVISNDEHNERLAIAQKNRKELKLKTYDILNKYQGKNVVLTILNNDEWVCKVIGPGIGPKNRRDKLRIRVKRVSGDKIQTINTNMIKDICLVKDYVHPEMKGYRPPVLTNPYG